MTQVPLTFGLQNGVDQIHCQEMLYYSGSAKRATSVLDSESCCTSNSVKWLNCTEPRQSAHARHSARSHTSYGPSSEGTKFPFAHGPIERRLQAFDWANHLTASWEASVSLPIGDGPHGVREP